MNHKFKKHDRVKLKISPLVDDIEYTSEVLAEDEEPAVLAGMEGEINLILPNGSYHVRVFDENGRAIAYVMLDEDSLESL